MADSNAGKVKCKIMLRDCFFSFSMLVSCVFSLISHPLSLIYSSGQIYLYRMCGMEKERTLT